MNRIAGSVALVVALTVGGLARAEDAGKAKIARKVLALTLTPASWHKITSALDAQLRGQFAGRMSDQEMQELSVEKLMPFQELADFQLGLLMKYYTADELKALADFYQSPVGKKTLQVQPELAQDVNGFLMQTLEQRLPAAEARIKRQRAQKAK